MKKYLVLCSMVLAAAIVAAKPVSVQSSLADSLFYDTYVNDSAATVTVSDFWNASHKKKLGYYPQQTIIIPAKITIEVSPIGVKPYMANLAVVAIADKAFAKAKATSVVFAEPSNVAVIGTSAFSSMTNLKGKLTLPASLDSLAMSSILLPGITEIEFLGEVPPVCGIGTYNPWTSASEFTPDSIQITVPAESLSLYQDAPGIGDYFTCLKKQPGPGTALEENEEATLPQQKKVLRNGRLYILRDGVVYDAQGQVVDSSIYSSAMYINRHGSY